MAATTFILRNTVLNIQSALAVAKTITAITKATEAVITGTHDFIVGDHVVISGVVGMGQINDRVVRVKTVTTTVSFVAEGLDSTGYSTYTSGGIARKVTFGKSFDNVTQLELPDASPEELDATAISDDEKQIVFGHASAQKGTLSLIANPLSPAVLEVLLSDSVQERRAFQLIMASGQKAIFNAYASGGAGFSGGVGALATAQISLTLRNKPQWFVS